MLTASRDPLDNLLDEVAERKLTPRLALAMLVEREVARQDERRRSIHPRRRSRITWRINACGEDR